MPGTILMPPEMFRVGKNVGEVGCWSVSTNKRAPCKNHAHQRAGKSRRAWKSWTVMWVKCRPIKQDLLVDNESKFCFLSRASQKILFWWNCCSGIRTRVVFVNRTCHVYADYLSDCHL